MQFIMTWAKSMWSLPKRVLFVAAVCAVAAIYVSQEVSNVSAQTAPPPSSPPPSSPPPSSPPPGGTFSPPPGGTSGSFAPPPGGSTGMFAPPQGGTSGGMFGPPPGGSTGQFGSNHFGTQGSTMGMPSQGMMNGKMGQGQFGQGQMGQGQGMMNDKSFGQQGMQQGMPNAMNGKSMMNGKMGQGQFGQGQMGQGKMGQGQGMMGQNGGSQFGQGQGRPQFGGEGSGGEEGNGEERFEKMRQEQMKRQFSQMKRGMKQMGSMFKKASSRVAALEKQGVAAPEELKQKISGAQAALDLILAAESMEDDGVQEAMETLQEVGHSMQEDFMKLEQLAQIPRIMKEVNGRIKQLEASYKRTEKAASRSKVDVSGQLEEFKQTVDAIKAAAANAEQLAKSGDFEGAMETLQSDVFEKMQDAFSFEQMVQAIQNVRKFLGQFQKFGAKAAKDVTRLEKRGEDVGEVKAAVEEYNAKVDELKQLLANRVTDPEELRDLVDGIFELQGDLQSVLGGSTNVPQFQEAPKAQSVDFSQFNQILGPSSAQQEQ